MWWYLFYTFILEIPFLFLFFRKQDKWWMIILIGVLLSSFTWPLGMYAYHEWKWNIYLLEFLIALTEGVLIKQYWDCSWSKALTVSFLMNGFSFLVGLIST
jgi:ABC-type multidrug transport system permease subunit